MERRAGDLGNHARHGGGTNHGGVLVAVAADSSRTIRQIAAEVGITERATHGPFQAQGPV